MAFFRITTRNTLNCFLPVGVMKDLHGLFSGFRIGEAAAKATSIKHRPNPFNQHAPPWRDSGDAFHAVRYSFQTPLNAVLNADRRALWCISTVSCHQRCGAASCADAQLLKRPSQQVCPPGYIAVHSRPVFSSIISLPSSFSLLMAPLTDSNVSMVVMAAGTARIMFVPIPL